MTAWTSSRAGTAWLATVLAGACPALLSELGVSPTRVAASVALAFLPYAWLIANAGELDVSTTRRLAFAGALSVGLPMVLAPAVLSDDLYRYLWDGRVLTHGVDPYAYAPDHPRLSALRDALWTRINHRDIATIYPPLAQLWFALGDLIAHAPIAPKLLALVAHLVTIELVSRLGGRHGTPHAALVFALNPLALSESALQGHVDALAGAALVATVLALEAKSAVRVALSIALASGTKLVGLLLVPFAARLRIRALALTAFASVLVLAPLALHAGDERGGLGQYARRWRGNDAGFSVVEAGVTGVLRHYASVSERARGHVRLDAARPVLERLAGTALDPWRGVLPEHEPIPDRADFELPFLSGLLTRAIVLLLTLSLPWLLVLAGVSPLVGARATLFTALFLSPQVHPWYLLWLLPLDVAAGAWAAVAWSVTVLVAYAPLDLWQRARIWNEWSLANLCEFAAVALVLLADTWVFKRTRHEHAGLSAMPNRTRAE